MSFGFAQGLGSFVGDFSDESGKIRQANERKNSEDAAIEQRGLEHLANSDDPEIRAAAVTAMLTPKTMGKGGGLFGKWFGTQRAHPVYDQVRQLMGGGGPGAGAGSDDGGMGVQPRQAFLSVEERSAQQRGGAILGATRGAAQGMREEGLEPPPGMIEGVARGASGGPQSRPLMASQPGLITLEDGTTTSGSFDKSSGYYYDEDGNFISGVKGFVPSSGAGARAVNPNSGGTWQDHVPDRNSPTGFSKVHVDANGKEMGRTTGTAPSAGPPNQIFQTPTGFQGVQPGRAGQTPQVIPVQGGNIPTHTENPSINFNTLRDVIKDIDVRATKSVASFGTAVPPDPAELQAARDREAKVAGFNSWAEAQAQLAAAQRAVGGAVQGAPPPGPIEGRLPAAGGPARSSAPAPGKGGAVPGKGQPKPRAATPGKIDINAVLAELNKYS